MFMNKESSRTLTILSVFAIAMGFFESAVVIYLRKIYYPDGFAFPLQGFLEPFILNVEWIREISTIIMLVCIGYLAGKNIYERIAYFIFSFAVWDIFYYIFLKITLDWPASLLTLDLLFLIPLPWIAPVLAPIIISITMIMLSLIIIGLQDKGIKVNFSNKEWSLFILGSIIILYTFLYDYSKLIFAGGFAKDFFTLSVNPAFIGAVSSFIPEEYNWLLFFLGEIFVLLGIFYLYNRLKFKKLMRHYEKSK